MQDNYKKNAYIKDNYEKTIENKICWSVTLFLILNPVITLSILVFYFLYSQDYTTFQVLSISLFAVFFAVLTNLSITMGYHRLFAHKSYEAHPVLEFFLLLIGAGAFQGSALKWASDHRIHHQYEDTDKDPYSINKGFFYAHMGWMMMHSSVSLPVKANDLEKKAWVMRQHNHYMVWAISVGYLLPLIVGAFLGNALLGLALAGGLRIFLTQQSTFFVNSLSHTLGKTPYSKEITAKDSIIVSILTHGEGYHNFHHKFQIDYRNGIKWYHWDPTKWSIQLASLLGLAKKLRTVQFSEILKAKLEVESEKFKNSDFYLDKLLPLSTRLVENQKKFDKLKSELKDNYSKAHEMQMNLIKIELKILKNEINSMKKSWSLLIESGALIYRCSRINQSTTDNSRI